MQGLRSIQRRCADSAHAENEQYQLYEPNAGKLHPANTLSTMDFLPRVRTLAPHFVLSDDALLPFSLPQARQHLLADPPSYDSRLPDRDSCRLPDITHSNNNPESGNSSRMQVKQHTTFEAFCLLYAL